jgi:dihydroorotase
VNITWLVKRGVVDVRTLIEKMSCAPARLFGLPGGTFAKGALGDVTVFDPTAEWKVDAATFRSKGRNTPYRGHTLTGRVDATVVGGRVVFQRGE